MYDAEVEIPVCYPGKHFILTSPCWVSWNFDEWTGEDDFQHRAMEWMLEQTDCIGPAIIPEKIPSALPDAYLKNFLRHTPVLKYKKLFILYQENYRERFFRLLEWGGKHTWIIGGFCGTREEMRMLQELCIAFSFGPELMGYNVPSWEAVIHCPARKMLLHTAFSDVSIKYLYKKTAGILQVEEETFKTILYSNQKQIFNEI